jgi:hypothetical protein
LAVDPTIPIARKCHLGLRAPPLSRCPVRSCHPRSTAQSRSGSVRSERRPPRNPTGPDPLQLRDRLPDLSRLRAIVGDRAYRGLARLAERKHVALDIKAPAPGRSGFTPIWPLYKVEHTIAQLGRWRRLSRWYEGTEASARAWLEVASVGYLAWRASV